MADKKQGHPITIKQDEKNPEPMELIAASIIEIASAVRKLHNGKLKQRVILLLIKDMTSIPLGTIEVVLNAIEKLEKTYLK